jgi:predicted RNA polymerase sigma factor
MPSSGWSAPAPSWPAMAARTTEARDAYRRARELTDDGAERRFLERRLTELAATPGSG